MKNAQWIWKDYQLQTNDYAIFYKKIRINETVNDAFIKISAHNHFKLFINDQRVNGFVSPASSAASKVKYFLEYDIKKYLKEGENKIMIHVLYLGGAGQNYEDFFPGMICEAEINLHENKMHVISDLSWRHFDEIPYQLNMPFQQQRKITPVEFYDATIALDEKNLKPVMLSQINDKAPKLVKQMIPDGAIHETIRPKFIQYKDGISVFDIGQIMTGFVKFDLKGYAGLTINIRYSEDLEDNFVKYNVANEFSDTYMDKYKMKGETLETYTHDFTYKSFRYFQIEGYPTKVDESMVTGLFASTGVDLVGHLASNSYPIINELFTMFKNTQLNNIQGMLTDCPHREQAQYLGDSFLQSEAISYNIKHNTDLIHKVLFDFKYSMLDDHTFPFVAPGNVNEEFDLKIPEYDLYFYKLWEKLIVLTNDSTYIDLYKDTAKKLLDKKLELLDEQGLILKNNEWHISDWPYPEVNQDSKHLTVENLLTLEALRIYDDLVDAPEYKAIYKQLKEAIRKHLMKDGLLADGSLKNDFHQGVNALGLEYNIFNSDEIEKVITFIKSKRFGSSVILSRSVVKIMFKYGELDFAFKYLFGFEKGWKVMMDKGYKTFWEGFDDIESHSHAWNGHPVKFIQKYVLGIHFDKKDNSKVTIRPNLPSFMDDIEGKVVCKHGLISLKVKKTDNHYKIIYNIPNGMHAFIDGNSDDKLKTGSSYESIIKIT